MTPTEISSIGSLLKNKPSPPSKSNPGAGSIPALPNQNQKIENKKMKTKSLMTGWEKVGKSHYRHETKVEVLKTSQGWNVIGGSNCGYVYSTMWVAMYEAAKTQAEFVKAAL
jgi:hypothetical protein